MSSDPEMDKTMRVLFAHFTEGMELAAEQAGATAEEITWIVADLTTGEIREETRLSRGVSPEEFMNTPAKENGPGA